MARFMCFLNQIQLIQTLDFGVISCYFFQMRFGIFSCTHSQSLLFHIRFKEWALYESYPTEWLFAYSSCVAQPYKYIMQ